MGSRWILAVGLVTACVFAARAAGAAPGAVWWVDASGACEPRRTALQREVSLACEAVGGTCHVARTPAGAELVAHLDCESPDAPWVLETRTAEGTLLGRVELAADGDDRLREAAVEIARDAAPERELAAAALRDALPGGADARPKRQAPGETTVSAALGPRGTLVDQEPATAGGGAFLAVRIAGALRAVGSFSAELGGTGVDATRVVRGGAGLAVGAPFATSSVVGARVELGVRDRQSYTITGQGIVGAGVREDASAVVVSQTTGYAAAGIYAQWPDLWIRPFVGCTLTAPFSASAELGVAMDLF